MKLFDFLWWFMGIGDEESSRVKTIKPTPPPEPEQLQQDLPEEDSDLFFDEFGD